MARLDNEGRIYYPTLDDGSPDITKRLALKRYLAEQEGSIITNIWTDIPPLGGSGESLGYATQKPIALLSRIIKASSDETVPYCNGHVGAQRADGSIRGRERPWRSRR
jgi:site-specific DNA-methyltransferase (adenine-specific)